MRFFLLFLILLLAAACETARVPPGAAQSPTARKRASVQFFLIYEAPASDLAERKVEATGETVFLAAKPDLTNADIAWAEMQVDPISSRPSVLVHFTPVGTDKLAALTKQNIGRRMAIILDGRVLATPLITSEIGDGRATLQGFKSAGEAQWVADSLAQR
jgi:preprotein translocase subunit SecD